MASMKGIMDFFSGVVSELTQAAAIGEPPSTGMWNGQSNHPTGGGEVLPFRQHTHALRVAACTKDVDDVRGAGGGFRSQLRPDGTPFGDSSPDAQYGEGHGARSSSGGGYSAAMMNGLDASPSAQATPGSILPSPPPKCKSNDHHHKSEDEFTGKLAAGGSDIVGGGIVGVSESGLVSGMSALGGNLSAASAAQPMGGHEPPRSKYIADKEDLLDRHVAYYLRHHPDVYGRNTINRKRSGEYEINGREVLVEWQYAVEPGGQGFLVVLDGPLRQPFADYMENTEENAEYDTRSIGQRSSLQSIPREKRISFSDQHKVYTRLEAMKVAKEQALVREKAADLTKDGREVPTKEMMDKYEKTIDIKLGGKSRWSQNTKPSGAAHQAPNTAPVTPASEDSAQPGVTNGAAQQGGVGPAVHEMSSLHPPRTNSPKLHPQVASGVPSTGLHRTTQAPSGGVDVFASAQHNALLSERAAAASLAQALMMPPQASVGGGQHGWRANASTSPTALASGIGTAPLTPQNFYTQPPLSPMAGRSPMGVHGTLGLAGGFPQQQYAAAPTPVEFFPFQRPEGLTAAVGA